jgi:UDP-N-acetylmuramoyl-tripeptide--D-alanyl-D-alanine ligase
MKNLFKKLILILITFEAKIILFRYKPKIIAITGNVGKTTTKDVIYSAFSGERFVRKSEKSLNSEFGVPLTIIGCESGWNSPIKWIKNIIHGLTIIILPNHYPKWLILEIGADRPGDIKTLARWIKPDVAVITGIPDVPVHIEFFDSVDEVADEKRALADALKPEGSLILNGDDARSFAMRRDFRGVSATYGFSGNNDFVASHLEINYQNGNPVGITFRVNHAGSSVPITIHGALGKTHIYPVLAAIAVGISSGLDLIKIAEGISIHVPTVGRMKIVKGIRETTIIDDSYNSSPIATLAALETIEGLSVKGRKIIILGDMLELGDYSLEAHKEVGNAVGKVADHLITVGIRARGIAEAAMDAGMSEKNILQYEQNEAERAGEELEHKLQKGDVILIKGSQSMRMERTVKAIMAEPIRAKELLVRQEKEWLQLK